MATEWTVPVAVSLGIGIPLIIYILLSLFFFYKPNILHTVKRLQSFKGRSISHRGGGGEKLEGTMAAFTNAVEHGTDALEMDVRLTSDDVVVVFHDETLERCCGLSKAVRDVTYEELPELKSQLSLYYRQGHVTEGDDRRIMTLREVFEKFTDKPIMIEIKGTEALLVQKMSGLIKEFDREGMTVWGSESNDTSALMFKENPQIPQFFCYKRGLIMLFYFYTGLLPFIKLKESVLVAPMPAIELDPDNGIKLTRCERIKKWITDKLFMRSSLFWHLSARGIDGEGRIGNGSVTDPFPRELRPTSKTYLYTPNKDSEFDRAFKQLKVTGVLTDFPSVLSDYLERNKNTTETDSLLQTAK